MDSNDNAPPSGYVSVGHETDQIFVPQTKRSTTDRLGVTPDVRIIATGLATAGAGVVLGIMNEYGRAALRFRAENAHRLPRSEKNWFFYHRAKSYYAMSSALPAGLKMGLKLAPVSMGFLIMEEGIDHARGGTSKDLLSTVTAGMSIAGLYSILTRQRIPEAGRMVKTGMILGLICGTLEDTVSFLTGQRLFYVDYIKRAFGSSKHKEVANTA